MFHSACHSSSIMTRPMLRGGFFVRSWCCGAIETRLETLRYAGCVATIAPAAVGGAIHAGHYLAEEAPDELLHKLLPFLSDSRAPSRQYRMRRAARAGADSRFPRRYGSHAHSNPEEAPL